MPSQARSAFGTKLLASDMNTPATFTPIAELRSLKRDGPKQEEIDVTNHNQATVSRCMEFIMGLIDPGSASLGISWVPGNTSHRLLWDDLIAGTKRDYKIELFDSSETEAFSAFVMDCSREFPVDDVLSADIELRVTGLPTLT